MDHQRVHECVEVLCQSGCDMVRATISAMESGMSPSQVSDLKRDEANLVLNELKAIMSVYDERQAS
ncbi:MAG: hypothetical protein HUJ30_06390 [Gammaproteobacteria bacterium]|nr:hypothetical protein [Gammaproteobacteria bacterium]